VQKKKREEERFNYVGERAGLTRKRLCKNMKKVNQRGGAGGAAENDGCLAVPGLYSSFLVSGGGKTKNYSWKGREGEQRRRGAMKSPDLGAGRTNLETLKTNLVTPTRREQLSRKKMRQLNDFIRWGNQGP